MVWETQRLEESDSQSSENILAKGSVLQKRYEIIKVLGVGGMGAVYLAQDLRFSGAKRMCAIKEMTSNTPDPQVRRLGVETFKREANLLVQLRHPGIPTISDFFTESVRSYLVMEYVKGENLEEVLEKTEGMLDEDRVLNWTVQICDVLVHLHGRTPPIVFRDLKPANIMLGDGEKIALIDFGIAKTFETGEKHTMIGTEGYSPPEQYKGMMDPRVDIYALGATLHHLLTKRDPRLEPPFTFHDEPAKLLNPTLSQETNDLTMKALEYDADKRFQTAQELQDVVSATLNRDKSAPGKASSGTQVLPSSPSSHTMPLTEQPAVPQQQPPQPYPPPQQPYPPPQYPPQYPPPQYPYQYPPPPQQYPGPMPGMEDAELAVDDSILPIWKFKCEDEVRGSPTADENNLYIGVYDNNVYALDLKSGKFQWKYPTEGGIAVRPSVYKDRLIFGSEDRIVYAITTTGRLVWTCPTEGRIRSSAVVEFDHAFFGSDDHRLYALNAQTGRVIWRFEAIDAIRSSPKLGNDMVYTGSEDGHVYAIDMSKGTARWKFRANRNITSSPALYENIIVIGSSDWNVYGLDAKTGYSIWQLRTGKSVISSPVIFDDTAYIGSTDNNLYAIDVKSGKLQWKFDAGSPVVSTPAITNEAVYFGTMAGELISITRKFKKLRWKFKTGSAVPSSPLIVDGIVYIGSMDHYVYALPA